MNSFNVITVGNLTDFVEEVRTDHPIRFHMDEYFSPDQFSTGGSPLMMPAKRCTLDVQGFNECGDLIWFHNSVSVHLNGDGQPNTPMENTRYWAAGDQSDIVKTVLLRMGYTIRDGRYVLPQDCLPINGIVSCIEWELDERGHPCVRESGSPFFDKEAVRESVKRQLERDIGDN